MEEAMREFTYSVTPEPGDFTFEEVGAVFLPLPDDDMWEVPDMLLLPTAETRTAVYYVKPSSQSTSWSSVVISGLLVRSQCFCR